MKFVELKGKARTAKAKVENPDGRVSEYDLAPNKLGPFVTLTDREAALAKLDVGCDECGLPRYYVRLADHYVQSGWSVV